MMNISCAGFYVAFKRCVVVVLLLASLWCGDVALAGEDYNVVRTSGADCLTSYMVDYKSVDGLTLDMMVMHQSDIKDDEQRVAMVLMHGGGWYNGDHTAMETHAEYFASQGLVLFLINYRTVGMIKSSTPKKSLMDAKSAMRYIRANADKFNIDPQRIIVGGGSAGGNLAAGVSMCPNINESTDDMSISSSACATVLFNPVICNGPESSGAYTGYNYKWVKDYYLEFSPMHNVREGVPPTIFMVGDEDHLIPEAVAKEYKHLIEQAGGRCDLHIYKGRQHSFYFIRGKNAINFYEVVTATHEFLRSLGYIDSEADVKSWLDAKGVGYYIK